MNPHLRAATPGDCAVLVELMSEFYAESGYPLNRQRAQLAFSELLADERLGLIWLIQAGPEIAGYVVLTLGYSMEYGGRDAFVDDLFIRQPPGAGVLASWHWSRCVRPARSVASAPCTWRSGATMTQLMRCIVRPGSSTPTASCSR